MRENRDVDLVGLTSITERSIDCTYTTPCSEEAVSAVGEHRNIARTRSTAMSDLRAGSVVATRMRLIPSRSHFLMTRAKPVIPSCRSRGAAEDSEGSPHSRGGGGSLAALHPSGVPPARNDSVTSAPSAPGRSPAQDDTRVRRVLLPAFRLLRSAFCGLPHTCSVSICARCSDPE
jgi:hypothetical protein